jgi:hypothetical protein
MDAEALKIILRLKEENITLKRALDECGDFLLGKRHSIGNYGMPEVDWFAQRIAPLAGTLQIVYIDKNGRETDSPFDKKGDPHLFKYVHKQ